MEVAANHNRVTRLKPTPKPKAIYSPHPLCAGADRQLFFSPFEHDETIAGYLRRHHIYPARPQDFMLLLNDVRLAPNEWETMRPAMGDIVSLRAVVHGGGNGKDPFRTILTIAVLVAASQTGLPVWTGSMLHSSYAVGRAIVAIGGMLLINALVPTKVPDLNDTQPSPNYSLSGSANRARLFEPLPLVFGTHRMYPDHGMKPYTWFEGQDQKLIQVFNFGLSDVAISDMKIGDTPLANFDDVVTEVSAGSTGELTSAVGNVDTVAGADLVANAGTYITKTSSIGTTRLGIDISGLSYYIDRGGILLARIQLIIEYSVAGAGTWLPFVGASATVDVDHGDKEIMRLGYTRDVAAGQYDVRVQLVNNAWHIYNAVLCDINGENCTSEEQSLAKGLNGGGMVQVLQWDQLKSYQPDTADYTGQKRLALSIKANAQLNGRIDAFNAMVSATIPTWTGSAWVDAVSHNPAWHFLWLARGKFDSNGQRLVGAGLPDTRIDIDELKAWGSWCDSKSLSCNLIIDGKINVDAALNMIARCGRATATWASGKLGVVYDEANKPVTAVFGMSNIIRNSFKVNYLTGKLVDEVVIAFTNPDLGYQRDTVRALVPGVTNPVNSVTIELRGITDKDQAGREALLMAGEQYYRRRQVIWETDMEGLAVRRGDVAMLSHDLTQWSYSGRLEAGTTTVLELDREVPFTPATQHYVGIRYPDGSYNIYDVILDTGNQSVITLSTALPAAPDDDTENAPRDYLWFFAPLATPGKLVKVTDVQPLSMYRARLTATDEDDNYYLREFESYTYVTPGSYAASLPTISDLQLSETLIVVGSGFASRVTVNWVTDGEYGGAFIRAKDANTPYKDIGKTLDRRFAFEWPTDRTITIEVVAFNLGGKSGANSRATKTLLLVGKKALPEDVQLFTATPVETGFMLSWAPVADVDLSEYEIRQGATWGTATVVDRVKSTRHLYKENLLGSSLTFWIVAIDTSGNESENPVSMAAAIDPPQDVVISLVYSGEHVIINYSADQGTFLIAGYEVRRGTDWASGTVIDINDGKATRYKVDYLNETFWVRARDLFGNESTEAGSGSTIVAPDTLSLRQEVIDNNVLLRWNKQQGTLPVAEFEIRKGDVYASAEVLQSISGTFAAFFEILSGEYKYWVTAIDTAGNAVNHRSVVANVSQPPDFVLNVNWASVFDGTFTNTFLTAEGSVLMPVDTTQTWATHFTGNSWSTPQDQINAGYDYYIEPGLSSGSYEEEFDYGTVLASTSIKIVLDSLVLDGTVTMTPNIKVKKLSGDAWTDMGDVWNAFATDFQYVKVTLTATCTAGANIAKLLALNVILDSKIVKDSGTATANAADSGGTTVNFTSGKFVDVTDINVTAKGTAAVTAVYDFTDVPNPTSFSVYLFNASGTRVSGDFSWTATGY